MGIAHHALPTPSPVHHTHLLQDAAEDSKARYQDNAALGKEANKARTSKEGLWRLLSATISILNHTHSELDRAQSSISDLERRVGQLETLASTDDMTGLKNRRGFDEAFSQEIDRINRGASKGGVMVLIDLDNFKAINDTHSHLAGDACLKLVARSLANEVRIMDTAARLGGDEFVLMLSDASKEDVLERIQMMVWRLNNLSLIWNGIEIPVRASIGIKDYSKGENATDIYRAADNAMYRCKATNKEQIKA